MCIRDRSCSADGSSWKELGSENLPAIDSDAPMTYNFQYAFEQAEAQYVKVSFPADQKVLLDEIQILKNRTVFPERKPDELYPVSYTHLDVYKRQP